MSCKQRIARGACGETNHAGAYIRPGDCQSEALEAENQRLKAEMEQTAERANREAQLACDLRTSQDEVIERCAKAVEEWPEAAARLRQHCGNSDETAVSGEDFGELRRQLQAANLAHEQYREWAAGQIEEAREKL